MDEEGWMNERGRKRGRERGSYQRRWWRRPAAPLRDGGRRATPSSSRRRWRRWPARDALPLLSAAMPCSSLCGSSGVQRGLLVQGFRAAALEIDGGGGARLGMGREKRVAQRLSPSYSRTHLIAGAPHGWFAGDNYTPGEPNRWCAGNNMGPAIRGT